MLKVYKIREDLDAFAFEKLIEYLLLRIENLNKLLILYI